MVPSCAKLPYVHENIVIERSEHFASLAICEVVSVFLLRIIWNSNCTLPGLDVSCQFAVAFVDGTLVVSCVNYQVR